MAVKTCACGCGAEFTPRRSDGRFASTTCRVRWNRAQKRKADDAEMVEAANVVAIAGRRAKPKPAAVVSGIEGALLLELGEAANTSIGQQALALARRIDANADGLSAMATASKQLTVLTRAALMEKAPDAEDDLVGAVQAEVIDIRRRYAGAGA